MRTFLYLKFPLIQNDTAIFFFFYQLTSYSQLFKIISMNKNKMI